jgi:hypothetical protein
MRSFGLLITLAASPVAGWGLFDFFPEPTAANGFEPGHAGEYIAAPQPTKPPYYDLELLRKRQSDPRRTCGWTSGLSRKYHSQVCVTLIKPSSLNFAESVDQCEVGNICATDSVVKAQGCCPTSLPLNQCYLATSCVDNSATRAAPLADITNSYVTWW